MCTPYRPIRACVWHRINKTQHGPVLVLAARHAGVPRPTCNTTHVCHHKLPAGLADAANCLRWVSRWHGANGRSPLHPPLCPPCVTCSAVRCPSCAWLSADNLAQLVQKALQLEHAQAEKIGTGLFQAAVSALPNYVARCSIACACPQCESAAIWSRI